MNNEQDKTMNNPNVSNESAEPQLLALPDAKDPLPTSAKLAASASPLLDVKARLQVCVGEAVMTVGELTNAKAGQVVTLDRQVDGPIDLLLEGKVVARGQLVAVGDYFGIRLTELPMPLSA
jgi:flagellar motor switch protein FliN/FliY